MTQFTVELGTDGLAKTLGVIAESQRRLERRLEEVWLAVAAPGRRFDDDGGGGGGGGGAGLGAVTQDSPPVRRDSALPALARGDAGELQDRKAEEDEGEEGQEDREEQMKNKGRRRASFADNASDGLPGHRRASFADNASDGPLGRRSFADNASDASLLSSAENHSAWGLPVKWPENLQAKKFGQRKKASSQIVKTFTEAMLDPSEMLEAGLADFNFKEARESLLINPHESPRLIFDTVSCAVLLYDLVLLPFMLAWDIPLAGPLWWIALLIDIFWAVDMVLNFFTGYYSAGILIMDPARIFKRYAKSWFVPDLLVLVCSAISLWLSQDVLRSAEVLKSVRFAKTVRLLRFSTVMRITKVSSVVERFADRSGGLIETLEAPGLLFLIVFINHVIACIWFSIGQSSLSDTGRSWLQTRIPGSKGEESTYETEGVLYQYLSSVHWSITQMTPGSLQIHPENSLERSFALLCLVSGMVFFSSIVSSLTATMTKRRLQKHKRAKELYTLRRLLLQNNIPTQLTIAAQKQGSERLRGWQGHVVADVRSMSFLAESMRARLHYELCARHLLHPIFRWWEVADGAVVHRLCNKGIDQCYLQKHDSLFHAGSDATSAYIVASGQFMYTQEKQTARVEARVQTPVGVGVWLCEAVLWADWVHVGHAEAECDSEALSVSEEQFKYAVESSRVTMFVFKEYGAAFHARLLSAQPPSSKYPTDLEVPCCSFEEIVPSLPLSARKVVSGPAFRQLRLSRSRWTRPGLIRTLAQQVQDGKCTLALAADKVIERVVVVVTLKLRRPDGRFLVELLDSKGWNVEAKLPGTKQREGETPKMTIGRLAATLEPYSCGMVWSSEGCSGERLCKATSAGIRSVYFRTTYEASSDPEVREDEVARVGLEMVPGDLIVLAGGDDRELGGGTLPANVAISFSGSVALEAATEVPVFKAYAWLDEAAFKHFKADAGRRQLCVCLEGARADVCAVAEEEACNAI